MEEEKENEGRKESQRGERRKEERKNEGEKIRKGKWDVQYSSDSMN